MLDAALIRVERGKQLEEPIDKGALHCEIAAALAALFQYMAAIL
jgi:hypothetical protein